MYPRVFGYSTYFAMWSVAAVACLVLGHFLIRRDRQPWLRNVLAGLCLVGIILVGSKLLYLLEARYFPAEDYVPRAWRGAAHGLRIPGGIALLALTIRPVCSAFALPWPRYGDRFALVVATMLVFVRLGCFFNGCCFGRVSGVPWAMEFPPASWAFYYHASRGWLPDHAAQSLPVHPLQLYFLLAALVTAAVVTWALVRGYDPGFPLRALFACFFASTMLLEPLRANYLTANNWLVTVGTLLSLAGLAVKRVPARAELLRP